MVFQHSSTRSRTAAAAVLALAAGLLAACSPTSSTPSGDDSGGASAGPIAPATVNVAVLPTANMAPLYLGQQQGYFSDENITLNITTVGGGADEIAGLQAGSFDFIAVGYVPLFAAAAQGLPVALFLANDAGGSTKDDDWQVVVAGKDSSIQGPQDLAGKTIGVNALNGVAQATTLASLEDEGVDTSGIKFVEVPFPQVPAAVDNGTIDAGFATEPFVTQTLDNGGRVVDNPSLTLGTHFPNGAWATSSDIAKNKADVLAAFTRAMTKSLDYAQANGQAVRDIIPTYTSIKADLAAKIRLPYFTSELDRTALQKLADLSVKYGAVASPVDLDALIVGQ